MKVVILAGGMGSRISEESRLRPKPMIEIGGKPVLWHIMKIYASQGFQDFVVCCGYKGTVIKKYFVDYYRNTSDISVSLRENEKHPLESAREQWKVTLINTGLHTLTAGRVLRVRDYLGEEPFMLTYGDGVGDVNLHKLLEFHYSHKKTATITAAKPAGRWGNIQIDEESGNVMAFREKNQVDTAWDNAGFAVFNKEIFDYLGDGSSMLENAPYEALVRDGQMAACRHEGFWHPMDTMRDKSVLEGLWTSGSAPWKVWE